MLLVLDVKLDQVEEDGVQPDEDDEKGEITAERPQVRARFAVRRQVCELARNELHQLPSSDRQ